MPRLALLDGRQDVVKADGTLEETDEVGRRVGRRGTRHLSRLLALPCLLTDGSTPFAAAP
jgi:hypothetical protein